MKHLAPLLCLLLLALSPLPAAEVRLTTEGFEIDAGTAGVYTMSYPRLLTPEDQPLHPGQITVKPDGSGAEMHYTPSGKLTIERQSGGRWLFDFREIPPDRVKFAFGIRLPLSIGAP